ncbi:pirin family protein [Christiangramia flava]|uniref:Pirin family proteins n=1 Tax=Christiangramia flava JLT2011 TaxID=1229726 RepID=A0A1L7I8W6_9FLAO|nr:pirin family protein [Christiangramia flava]APU69674.1 Pirin family proteins [Christiangramia flava JLT2011]OSS39295.1 Pirin family protein [Christiangramia flava JLT2011]
MEKVFHPANSRGKADFGWLKANYSFSFANFFDPNKTNFGLLRVLNDDTVAAGMGFGTHPHRDMEIITIPLSGQVRHRDSMDHTKVVKAGEVQVMSAGTGVEHSEMNPSQHDLNMLQIWIFPEKQGLEPRYDQKNYEHLLQKNELIDLVTPKSDQKEEAVWINQNAYLKLGEFESGRKIAYNLQNQEHGVYIFLIDGSLKIDDHTLEKRDAMGVWKTSSLTIEVLKQSKVLLIEVPMS